MMDNEPRFENCKPLLIAGLRGHFAAAPWEGIPAQWQRFEPHLGKIPGQVGRIAYGLCFSVPGGIDYLSGVEVSGTADISGEFNCVRIPAQKYAILPYEEHVSKLRNALDIIWHKWLPASGYEVARAGAGAPDFFERYGEGFDPRTGMGDIEVWIPIQS
jgi:AraC family transcriptional regulator